MMIRAVWVISFLVVMFAGVSSVSQGATLIGKVAAVQGDRIDIDIGSQNGIKAYDTGRIFYTITVQGQEKRIYIARLEITHLSLDSSIARIKERTGEVQDGHKVEMDIDNLAVDKAQKYDNDIQRSTNDIESNLKESTNYYDRGVAYGNKQQYDRAIEDFSKAIELNPRYDMAYYSRGLVYALKQQFDRAIEDFSKAIELNPRYDMAYIARGRIYNHQQQYDRAIEDFSKAIELNPSDYLVYDYRGTAYKHKQQYDRAIEDFSKAIELNPRYGKAYFNQAQIHSFMNNPTKACRFFKQAIENGFNNWSHIKSNRNLDNIRKSSCYKEIMSGR